MQRYEGIWTGGPPPAAAGFDASYSNSGAIAGAERFEPLWAGRAGAFREAMGASGRARLGRRYGPRPRQVFDLFLPEGEPRGTAVFVHGGYWMGQDIANWSHLAAGLVARGHAVALPDYTLCPETTVAGITAEIGAFLDHLAGAARGPIALCGHSAGGHLVARMLCTDAPIDPATAARIGPAVSISGVHDLRPLLATAMNATLRLDLAAARVESPALLEPRAGVSIACLAGGDELTEFRRQNALLANAWHGLGALTLALECPGRHHFDIVDELCDPSSPLVSLLAGDGTGRDTGWKTP